MVLRNIFEDLVFEVKLESEKNFWRDSENYQRRTVKVRIILSMLISWNVLETLTP
jgi:hypothetical protein